jgi:hypothetical protein
MIMIDIGGRMQRNDWAWRAGEVTLLPTRESMHVLSTVLTGVPTAPPPPPRPARWSTPRCASVPHARRYFEVLLMLHKLFLTTIVVFLDPGSPEQLLIAIIEIVIICGVVGIASPHCSKGETIM